MEDHLLELFGGHDTKIASHDALSSNLSCKWSNEALVELAKIPGFVRNRVKKNTEKFASENNIKEISLKIMYQAKEANSM